MLFACFGGAAFLRLSRLGYAMFLVYALGLFSSPKGVPKVPFWTRRMYCFLLYLSSDLGGVWLFRLRCRRASLQSSESASCMVLFSSMVLLLQLFLSVVVRFDAGRGLVDDPTSLGTRFSFWRLVRALYPATFLTRLNLLATFGACVGEAARDDTASDSKLLVTMAGRLHFSRLHGTVDCDMAIWTFIFQPFVCTSFAIACARCVIFLSMATLCFLDSRSFSGFGLDVFLRFAHLRRCSLASRWTCPYCFCTLRTLFALRALLSFPLLDFSAYFLQDLCYLCLRDLVTSSLQPGMRSLFGMLHVYAHVTLLSTVVSLVLSSPK